ncbi:hypothetical protein DEU56DRAFT_718042, partial [Suillus clintonianus]|uniref:uncharacterized protein n=1 Tax=Suillus clintonianus TaxID=1904413 RepID=UPI001B87E6C3
YGPINMMLTTYFTADHNFIVKKQPHHYQAIDAGGCISMDSYGQVVGLFLDDEIPNFVVSNVGSELDHDVLFLIFKVKRKNSQLVCYVSKQIEQYISWMCD